MNIEQFKRKFEDEVSKTAPSLTLNLSENADGMYSLHNMSGV